MTITEAAALLGVHRTRVWQWVKDGVLPSRQVGPILLVPRDKVLELKDKPRPKVGRPRKSSPAAGAGPPAADRPS